MVKSSTSSTQLDPAAWVESHGDLLFRYAMLRLRDRESAEEVVQDTFVAALKNVGQFAGKGTERGWLLGILKRKIVDLVRQRNRAGSLPDDLAADPNEALFDHRGHWKNSTGYAPGPPLDSLERQDFWRILEQCLAALPQRHADVFVLREMDQHSSEKICKELQITPSNLWVILYRARMALARCMKSRWNQETT